LGRGTVSGVNESKGRTGDTGKENAEDKRWVKLKVANYQQSN